MKVRLKFYGPLLMVNVLSLMFLLFFFNYNWYVNDYQNAHEALNAVVSQNPRWITWGTCAGSVGLVLGLMSVIWLLIPVPNEVEEDRKEFILDLTDRSLKLFPSIRGIAIFIACVVLFMLVVNEEWRLGLRDAFEIFGVIAWSLFLITSLILIPTFLIDCVKTFLRLTRQR